MQLTRTRKIVGALAFSAVMALTGVTGFAQQQTTTQDQEGSKARGMKRWGGKGFGGRRGGLFGGRLAEQLNLTDAQKEQIKQITTRYRESAKAQREQRRDQRTDGFNGGTFDEAQVRAAAQARANARVEREVARARMMSEIYNVLTAEQKAQLATLRQQREQRMQERRARRNANSGQTTQQ